MGNELARQGAEEQLPKRCTGQFGIPIRCGKPAGHDEDCDFGPFSDGGANYTLVIDFYDQVEGKDITHIGRMLAANGWRPKRLKSR